MGVPRVWAIKRDHGAPLGKRGTHGDGLVVARVGVLVVVGGGVRGHHRRHHRRLPRRQGDAAAGHHRPTRAYPGHPGQPQSVWCVGLGRGGPWWAWGRAGAACDGLCCVLFGQTGTTQHPTLTAVRTIPDLSEVFWHQFRPHSQHAAIEIGAHKLPMPRARRHQNTQNGGKHPTSHKCRVLQSLCN